MKPTLILPRGAMSIKHMAELRENGICVAEVSDPNLIKFVDIPLSENDLVQRAAVHIVRGVVCGGISLGWETADEKLRKLFAQFIESRTRPPVKIIKPRKPQKPKKVTKNGPPLV